MARRALTHDQLALVQAVQPWLDEIAGPIKVGVSGGVDSMALAATLGLLAAERIEAVIVDHGLQEGSDALARQVLGRVQALGLQGRIETVLVHNDGQGIEAAARGARLLALAGDGCRPVMLAHTLDDQAETVLLGLARGSGPTSLSGMVPRRGPFIRPLLGLRRATTTQACQDWGIPVWDDPMNEDPRFLRVRVRRELMPTLESVLGPGTVQALGRTADLLRVDHDLLDRLSLDSIRDVQRGDELDAVGLLHLHPALRGRVLHRWLQRIGVESPSHEHVRSVLRLVEKWHGQAGVDLPGGIRVRRVSGWLVVDHPRAG
ncbi:tRNA lysidine(34) synthetase TilS [Luteococcus sp. Sow4_B9]|uniref:tRNA lysidine(34) synthetase TilS n=1 Tax=Luteococcus sp. Sow4_B9 TaxID=3438792 RepID=UPI003F98631A